MNHPDLINNLVTGRDFVASGSTPIFEMVSAGHSTWCAGLIAAQGNNGIGVTGVAWDCKVMPVRILSDTEAYGHTFLSDADKATAIRWAAANGADVVDIEWAGAQPMPPIAAALVDITEPGGIGRNGKGCVVVVCAVGNSLVWPAKYPEVIAVGATDHNDMRASYSFQGPELDIVSPNAWQASLEDWVTSNGRGALLTTDVTGSEGASSAYVNENPDDPDYTLMDGIASVVSGVAALILSIEPDLTNEEVRHFLEKSAKDLGDPGHDEYYGWGRVDARAALDMVLAKRCDLNDDCKVDMEDLLILIKFWRTAEPSADIAPATKRDGIVDEQDVELMMRYWQVEIPEMDPIAQ